jgi:hypothetical protein
VVSLQRKPSSVLIHPHSLERPLWAAVTGCEVSEGAHASPGYALKDNDFAFFKFQSIHFFERGWNSKLAK